MRCSYAMTSASVTSPIVEEGADVDGAEREGGSAESDCLDRNCASLCFTIVASMTHMKVKWLEGKGIKKWRKILIIVEGKMSLSQDAESK